MALRGKFTFRRQRIITILDFIVSLINFMFTIFLRRRAYLWWGKCGVGREFHTRTRPNTGVRSATTRIVYSIFHIRSFPGRVPPGPLYPVLYSMYCYSLLNCLSITLKCIVTLSVSWFNISLSSLRVHVVSFPYKDPTLQ